MNGTSTLEKTRKRGNIAGLVALLSGFLTIVFLVAYVWSRLHAYPEMSLFCIPVGLCALVCLVSIGLGHLCWRTETEEMAMIKDKEHFFG
jgi:hypothetical protein